MRIALAQIVSSPDPWANLEQVRSATGLAASQGAELVIFPEATMRCFGHDLTTVAEPVDGPWADQVRSIAATAGVSVAVGMFTPGENAHVRNTLLISGPGVDAAYEKIHLFDAFGFAESKTVAAGDKPVVVEIGGLSVGFAICYDVRFPGLFTTLAEQGAELICVCASWGSGPGKIEQWELLTRARALDSTTFIAACGQGDPTSVGIESVGSAPTGVGHSAVISPSGVPLAALGPEPGLLVVDIDPQEIAATRAAIPVLANRRF